MPASSRSPAASFFTATNHHQPSLFVRSFVRSFVRPLLPSLQVRSETLPPMGGHDVGATVVGFAKGAGMIEPHLATMLAYVLTDLDVPKEVLQKSLRDAVKR